MNDRGRRDEAALRTAGYRPSGLPDHSARLSWPGDEAPSPPGRRFTGTSGHRQARPVCRTVVALETRRLASRSLKGDPARRSSPLVFAINYDPESLLSPDRRESYARFPNLPPVLFPCRIPPLSARLLAFLPRCRRVDRASFPPSSRIRMPPGSGRGRARGER